MNLWGSASWPLKAAALSTSHNASLLQVIQRLQHSPTDTAAAAEAAAAAQSPAADADAAVAADGQGAAAGSSTVVLAVAAHPQLPLLASGLHGGDHSIKVWQAGGS
jgi:hypothetical protein